jgi:hypothetical protein
MRPAGITIMGVLSIIAGVFGLIRALLVLGLGALFSGAVSLAHPLAGAVVGIVALAVGLLALVIPVLYLVFGYGCLTLRPWAWGLGVVTAIGSLVWGLLAVLGPGTLRGHFVSLLMAALIAYYLTRPEVKGAFGESR